MRSDIASELEIQILTALESGATADEVHELVDGCVAEYLASEDEANDNATDAE